MGCIYGGMRKAMLKCSQMPRNAGAAAAGARPRLVTDGVGHVRQELVVEVEPVRGHAVAAPAEQRLGVIRCYSVLLGAARCYSVLLGVTRC